MLEADRDSKMILIPPVWWDRRAMIGYGESVPTVEFFLLPTIEDSDSLRSFAVRCCDTLGSGLLSGNSMLLAYGEAGPLAIEIAIEQASRPLAKYRYKTLLLLSSARTSSGLGRSIRRHKNLRRLSKRLVLKLFQRRLASTIAPSIAIADGRRIVEQMMREADQQQWERYLGLLCEWHRTRNEVDLLTTKIHQLNGRDDTLFELPLAIDATLLGKANQWMWFTHKQSVSNWINAVSSPVENRS